MSDELSKQITLLEKLLKKEENKFCADCRRKSPSWASMTQGVFICIKCAGFHRELGVHITKIKSVNLDKWPKGVANLFTKINNKIANSYWESKMPEMNFEKLQNDESRLFDFVKDKYERRRWAAKGKDPMTLIYEGKDPEVVEQKQSRNSSKSSDDSDRGNKNKKQQTNNAGKNLPNFSTTKESQLKNQNAKVDSMNSNTFINVNKYNGNNGSLIDFNQNVPITNNLPEDMFIPVIEEENAIKKNETNFMSSGQKSGFSFINKNIPSNSNGMGNTSAGQTGNSVGSSLIDLQSYESQKSNQLKQLTESITNIYNNPNQNEMNKNPQQRNMSYTQMNQPNINISNTYYNMNYPNNNMGVNNMGLNQAQNNMYPMMNQGLGMNQGIGMNMGNMGNMGNPYMNRMQPPIQPQTVQGIPNNPSFNYDYYNNINNQKANSSMGFNYNMGSSLGNFNEMGSSMGGHNYNHNAKKKDEDPFKQLVHFK